MPRELECELCGATFTCQTGAFGCWCEKIKLTPEATAELERKAKDCVCPTCLTKFSTKS
ncbi:MAG: cysteine-rich CWC family protein [Candidatus Bathyarchaeia archaeon]